MCLGGRQRRGRLGGRRETAAQEEARAVSEKSWSWAKKDSWHRAYCSPEADRSGCVKADPRKTPSQKDTLPSLSAATLIPRSILPPPTCLYRDPVRNNNNNKKRKTTNDVCCVEGGAGGA